MATHAPEPAQARRGAAREEAERLGLAVEYGDEHALAREVAGRWQQDNAQAIASSNAWVERNGLPLGRHRRF